MAEERVERLRQELKEIQKKRDDSFSRTPPAYILPSIHHTNPEFPQQNQRQIINNEISPLLLRPNLNLITRLSPTSGEVSAAFDCLSLAF